MNARPQLCGMHRNRHNCRKAPRSFSAYVPDSPRARPDLVPLAWPQAVTHGQHRLYSPAAHAVMARGPHMPHMKTLQRTSACD